MVAVHPSRGDYRWIEALDRPHIDQVDAYRTAKRPNEFPFFLSEDLVCWHRLAAVGHPRLKAAVWDSAGSVVNFRPGGPSKQRTVPTG